MKDKLRSYPIPERRTGDLMEKDTFNRSVPATAGKLLPENSFRSVRS